MWFIAVLLHGKSQPNSPFGVFTSMRAVTLVPDHGSFLLPLSSHACTCTVALLLQVFKLLPGFPCWVMSDGERHCNAVLIAGGIFLGSELLKLPQLDKIPEDSLYFLPALSTSVF